MPDLDPAVLALAQSFIERTKTGRAVTALRMMIAHGSVTTGDLSALGYEHPPRAIADIRNGIPVVTEQAVSGSGKRMARYRLGTAEQIRQGQAGRTSFSKRFKSDLIAEYGSRDGITGATHDTNSLQIDHRVPFRVSGDAGLGDVKAFMLLDGKSQRAKSWSCEHCENFIRLRDPAICGRCYWAYPDEYDHVAMQPIRRCDIVWLNDEVAEPDIDIMRNIACDRRGQASLAALVRDRMRNIAHRLIGLFRDYPDIAPVIR